MANTSATGGILTPTLNPTEGVSLRRFIGTMLAGVTGINPTLVRPLWQSTPPATPNHDVDWIAFGVDSIKQDASPYYGETKSGDGSYSIRHEDIAVKLIAYGPNCQHTLSIIRDGLCLSQNRETLFLNGMGFADMEDIVHAPELINNCWYDRCDSSIVLRREIKRLYNILSFTAYSTQNFAPNGTQNFAPNDTQIRVNR